MTDGNDNDRNEFVERLKAQIDEWNAEIKKMEAQAEKAAEILGDEWTPRIRDAGRRIRRDVVLGPGRLRTACR